MKYLLIALASFLVVVWSSAGWAQNTSSTKPPVRKFKHNSKVESIYDKAKDQTTTYLRPMTLKNVKSSTEVRLVNEGRTDYLPSEILSMTAYFNSPGKVLAKPQFVIIGFRSWANDKTPYTNNRQLTANVDGSVIALGTMTIMEHRIDENMSGGSLRYIVESVELPIPYETFRRITRSTQTTLNLG